MSDMPITQQVMSEYYQRVFPTELVTRWLGYGESASFLSRREFCFTLVGDIFTRFRSYATEAALKAELVRSGPEKIDVGAVYNVAPDKKQTHTLVTVERELVFDIDMSDYDDIRSCCKGKQVCPCCWAWMSTAALVLRDLMENDFGFEHLLPVFSGRRGIHLWVLDTPARKLTDDERNAIVGYCTVIGEKGAINILTDLRFNKPHPSLARVHDAIIAPAFDKLFLTRTVPNPEGEGVIANPNCIFESPAAALVIYNLLLSLESQTQKAADKRVVGISVVVKEGEVWSSDLWESTMKSVGAAGEWALHFAAMYPRLDEKVSTRRDHLLKLPFCVHPGTGRLCTPLEWHSINDFNPKRDPPSISDLLNELGAVPEQWTAPLTRILATLEAERAQVKAEAAGMKAEPATEG